MRRCAVLLALSCTLVGCVSYKPVPDGYTGPLATVVDNLETVSSTRVHFFELSKVDGRPVKSSSILTREVNYGQGFALSPQMSVHQVPAGTLQLHLVAMTYVAAPILALAGGMYRIEGDVQVVLEADTSYAVKGVLKKGHFAVWLENAQGEIISSKIERQKD